MSTYLNGIATGVAIGGSIALLALGISLVFSTTGVLNLAQAGFAMVAAYFAAWFVNEHGWALWPACIAAVMISAFLGFVIDVLAMRRLQSASGPARFIASLGILSLMTGLVQLYFGSQPEALPPLFPGQGFTIGDVTVPSQHIAIIVTAVVLGTALMVFLHKTRTGLAIRAVSQDRTVARLMGVRYQRISALNWTIAAGLAGVAGVLIAPLTLLTTGTFTLYILTALAATLFGGVSGLVGAFVGGFAIGGTQGWFTTYYQKAGGNELAVLLVVLVLLAVRRNWPKDLTITAATAGSAGTRFFWIARAIFAISLFLAVENAVRVDFWATIGTTAAVYGIATLGLVVLTGWAAQVSLMQGALMGLSGMMMAAVWDKTALPLPIAAMVGIATAMAASMVVALASSRLKGLQVGILTLVVAGGISAWLLQLPFFPVQMFRPSYLESDRNLFIFSAVAFMLCLLVVRNLRISVWGKRLSAVRQSRSAAGHFGVSLRQVDMIGFTVAGFTAGVAGCVFVVLLQATSGLTFSAGLSIALLLYAVASGTNSLAGPVIAGLVFAFLPQVLTTSQDGISALPDILAGVLVTSMMLFRPGGLATLLNRPRAIILDHATDATDTPRSVQAA